MKKPVLPDYDAMLAKAFTRFLFRFATDYRWYSKVGMSWEDYQRQISIEKERYQAAMYRISIGILGS